MTIIDVEWEEVDDEPKVTHRESPSGVLPFAVVLLTLSPVCWIIGGLISEVLW